MKIINSHIIESFLSSDKMKEKTDLCNILEKFGSDKSSDWHNYSPLYNFMFSENRNNNLNFFEVGIYGGASVKSWKEYFKNSKIYGGDVNRDYFINEERIKSFFCDQDNPDSIRGMWESEELKGIQFDVIIDDGKHEYISNINFLDNSYHKLKEGGIFIVEDLTRFTFDRFREQIKDLRQRLMPSYMDLISISNENNTIDNNILIIQK